MSDPKIPEDFDKDFVVLSDQVKETLAKNSELNKVFKEVTALMRQAHEAWHSGKYETFEAALTALGLEVEAVTPDDDDYDYLMQKMGKQDPRIKS